MPYFNELIIDSVIDDFNSYSISENDLINENLSSRQGSYSTLILKKLGVFDDYQKKKFIKHQLKNSKDSHKWLLDLERLMAYSKSILGSTESVKLWLMGYEQMEKILDKLKKAYPEQKATKVKAPKIEKSFKFKSRTFKESDLKSKIEQLCFKVDLINYEKTSIDTLINILLSQNLPSITEKVHLGCNNPDFIHICFRLKVMFDNFIPASIGRTKLFLSNQNDIPISDNTFYANKSNSPSHQKEIDEIFETL
jgi:hypothetical protein